MSKALVIVDVQRDFLPGGALAVPDGDEVIDPIVKLAESGEYDVIVRSADHHPEVTDHFDKWPVHCVAGTPGAETDPRIEALTDVVFRKGDTVEDDGYSAFDGFLEDNRQILAFYLEERGVREVDVVGLALDYCVKATAVGSAGRCFQTRVLLEATRPVDPAAVAETLSELTEAGVKV